MTAEHRGAARFDDGALDPASCSVVQQLTREIKSLRRRTTQDDIDLGRKLKAAKERLAQGHFGIWLTTEFAWGWATAEDLLQVARVCKSVNFADLQVRTTALYALAAPSVPQSARDEAMTRAQLGETITCNTARAIIEGHRRNAGPLRDRYVAPG